MSDVIYRGPDNATPAPEPSVTARMYSPPDERDTPPSTEDDRIAVEESVKALHKQRAERGDPWGPDAITKRKYQGADAPEEITLRQANEDLSFTRRGEIAAEQVEAAKQLFGDDFSPPPEVIKQTMDEAHRWGDGVKAPPVKIGLRVDGTDIKPLDDDWPMLASDALPNAKLAAKFVGDWRQAREQEAQQFAAALDTAKAERAAEEQQRQQQAEAEAARQKAQQEAAQQQAQAAEQRRQAELRNQAAMSLAEHEAAREVQDIRDWMSAAYTPQEISSPTNISDPQRSADFFAGVQRFHQLSAGLQNAQNLRHAQQIQQAAVHEQKIAAWARGEDEKFWKSLEARYPALAKDPAKLHRATASYLRKTTGLSEAQIGQAWKQGRWRSAGEQQILLDAVVSDMAAASKKELASHRAKLPPVQRPGTHRPAGADADSDIASLERRMQSASPREQMRLATKLTQARRLAGRL